MASNYGEYMKARAKKDNDFFFGEGNKKMVSNKYFTYKHVIDNDTVIINTNNIKTIKGNYILIVGDSEAVYLKDWQIKTAHNYSDICTDLYLVKLSRKYFKPYKFNFCFEDFCFDGKVESFDDMLETAKAQDAKNMSVALGFMNF